MKKIVKASPLAAILFGVAALLCFAFSVGEFVDTGVTSAATIAFDALVFVAGVYTLFKYFSQSKICFDDDGFTVDGKSYSYDEITDVTVNSEQVLRSVSTLRVRVYIGEDEVCNFTKDDSCGKDFINLMKKHGVTVSIDV